MQARVSLLVVVTVCWAAAAQAAPAPLPRRTVPSGDFVFDAGTPERAARVAVLLESDIFVQSMGHDPALRQRFGKGTEAYRLSAKGAVTVEGSLVRVRPSDPAVLSAVSDRLTNKVSVMGWDRQSAAEIRQSLVQRLEQEGRGGDKRFEAYIGAAEVIVEPLTPLGPSGRRRR
jgi:hypothetical protein